MPDSASTPDHSSSTARATRSSHGSPAATTTAAPPHESAESTRTPRVATLTTVPSNPASGRTRFDPPAEQEQRLPCVVDLAHGVDELVGRLGHDHPGRGTADPHRRVAREGLVEQLLHQSRRTTARQRPEHLLAAGRRRDAPPSPGRVSASTALTTPSTTISAPPAGTTTGLVKRVPYSTTRPASPAQSATTDAGGAHRPHPVGDDVGQPDRAGEALVLVDGVLVTRGVRVGEEHLAGDGHRDRADGVADGDLGERAGRHLTHPRRGRRSSRCTSRAPRRRASTARCGS